MNKPNEYIRSNDPAIPKTLQEQKEELLQAFRDYKFDRPIIEKTIEHAAEERARQVQKLRSKLDRQEIPYGYKKEGDEIILDPHQSKVVQLMSRLSFEGLEGRDIKLTLNEMSVPKVATEGYDLDDHWDKIIERGKQILQERLEEEREHK